MLRLNKFIENRGCGTIAHRINLMWPYVQVTKLWNIRVAKLLMFTCTHSLAGQPARWKSPEQCHRAAAANYSTDWHLPGQTTNHRCEWFEAGTAAGGQRLVSGLETGSQGVQEITPLRTVSRRPGLNALHIRGSLQTTSGRLPPRCRNRSIPVQLRSRREPFLPN